MRLIVDFEYFCIFCVRGDVFWFQESKSCHAHAGDEVREFSCLPRRPDLRVHEAQRVRIRACAMRDEEVLRLALVSALGDVRLGWGFAVGARALRF